MKTLILVIAFGLVTIVFAATIVTSSAARGTDEHTEWIAKSLKEIEGVKIGMTRADLLKVFEEEAGLSSRTWRCYVYRNCAYIKVDVEFESVSKIENTPKENGNDKIIKISKPFLEWSIMD